MLRYLGSPAARVIGAMVPSGVDEAEIMGLHNLSLSTAISLLLPFIDFTLT
jgi:hypothetical protein